MEAEPPNSKFEIRNSQSPWLILGLGNPGERYAATYHNVGFRVIERMAGELGVRVDRRCGAALISGNVGIAGQTAILALPQTYMNRSGEALLPIFERCESSVQGLIVVYDDIALPLGRLRLRKSGSAGGHNGIKSLISTLGTDEFLRVRVGIRPDRETGEIREFVLSPVAGSDKAILDRAEATAANAVVTLIKEGIERAMALYNGVDLREPDVKRPEQKDS